MKLGPYEVLGELGRGGMGAVFRGRAPSGEIVALKLLHRVDAATLARFERERRLIGLFTARDGFVPLLDAGSSPEGPYVVMPLMTGGTLRERLGRGPLGVEETVSLGTALAEALGRAHDRGVVHRDVKPENVLFDGERGPGSRPLIADLGLGKHFDPAAPGASQSVSLSRSGERRGTPGNMAPEQIVDAKSAGPRADVFALGTVLYECLAGMPAFGGDTPLEVFANVAAGKLEPLGRARPDVAPWLVAVIEKALAVDAERRFADGGALARALRAGGAGAGRASRGRGLVVAGVLAVSLAGVVLARPAQRAPAPAAKNEPVEPATEPAPPRPLLPAGLREGEKVGLPGGTETRVHRFALPGDAGEMELVPVPAGSFVMGDDGTDAYDDEKPRHVHRVDHDYWIGRCDVTWRQYLAFCAATGATRPERPEWAGDEHPVVRVSWDDARRYCGWAKLALPTEAEWEKAARGASGLRYPWGEDWDRTRANFADRNAPTRCVYADGSSVPLWWRDDSADDGFAFTSPVGTFPGGASPSGALDMTGNVRQWCADLYDAVAYARYSGDEVPAPKTESIRVLRGGGWRDDKRGCRASVRNKFDPGAGEVDVGFRVCLRAPRTR